MTAMLLGLDASDRTIRAASLQRYRSLPLNYQTGNEIRVALDITAQFPLRCCIRRYC